ncbi:MAG: GlsB/YeaQ/YmgE family stress response membrane protein [Chitinophagales bacterium]|nr:GlsB/YeaQ/YmgE family stress response membrane protein [Chitinophagales bacterium]MDW8418266.1 GlsB/YeaQ/YmgE family stress response membrane protein [Chitinophagales bacterium]
MLSIIWTAIIGLLAGAIGKLIMPGKDPGGIIVTMLIGIGGSFVGKYLGEALQVNFLNGFGGAVLGAIIILALWRVISNKILNKGE